ncbi:MAG: hypothetical protein ACRC2S_14430 [Waterburya sp.]
MKDKVSLITLSGRIKVNYSGYNKHLDLIKSGVEIGEAKIWYDKAKKTYYLLVRLNLNVPELKPEDIFEIKGIDVGQRYLAVVTNTKNQTKFVSGKPVRHKASKYHKARKSLQHKGTRSARKRLISLSGRGGHVSQENRPNKGLTFRCIACNHTLHSDLVGARNIALRTLLLRQDFESTGRISAVPDVSHEETKAKYLPRYLELRWSADTIPTF